jgi:hypothetical protein
MSVNVTLGPVNTYKTTDLYFAAYLKVAKMNFIGVEKKGDRIFFLFEESELIKPLKRDYFNRKGEVPALTYMDEIKALKTIIHNT